MSLSRVTALSLSILLHSVVLVGFKVPQRLDTTEKSPAVIDFQLTQNIAPEQHSPVPKIQNPPAPARSNTPVEKPSEHLVKESIPTPTSTYSPRPTPTVFPTFNATEVPTNSPTRLPLVISASTPPRHRPTPISTIISQITLATKPTEIPALTISIPDPTDKTNLKLSEKIPGTSSSATTRSRDESAVRVYRQMILEKLESSRQYPREARRQRIEGNVIVTFAIREDGTLLNISIESSSGHEILDNATLDLVRKAFPMPSPPANTGEFRVTLRYSLKK